ncbi:hypothetical protein EN792_043230, partial [Mesorhizobium sp. M00.F.Ca.ET.149.01.1.1]
LFLVDSQEQRRMRIRDSHDLALEDWMGTAAFDPGMRVQAIETYDTTRIDYGDAEVLARLSEQPVGAALLYSAKASAALSSLIARPALKHLFEKTEFLALSSRVAEPLDGTAGRRIRIAPRPDEDALLALLSQPR